MSFGEKLAPLVGRILLASLFLLSGLAKLQHWNDAALAMARHGVTSIGPLLAATVATEVGAGFGLMIGFRTRIMALSLFMFTLIVSFVMHDFWTIGDADLATTQMQMFAKNIAIAGGLLVLVGMGGGPWSFDGLRGDD
jgi:putative oxidoreductase